MPPPAPDSSTPGPSLPPAALSRRWRRFLIVTAALSLLFLVLFREVLFPFIMAAFVAYLIDPVVAWMTRERRFGIRWGRGPVLMLMYAVLVTGIVSLVSCGATKVSES